MRITQIILAATFLGATASHMVPAQNAPSHPGLPGQGDAPNPAETEKVIPENQAPPSPTDSSQPSGLPPVRDGVIQPPVGLDPGINLPPPDPGSDRMPVIPPPATDMDGKPVIPK